MTNIVCVSAGMVHPKKADTPFARLHQYLNYGLLGLATVLSEQGHEVSLFHGSFSEPREFANQLHSKKLLSTKLPLLLSLPSSFAIKWAREFAAAIKDHSPELPIVIGGRWVTANDGAWVRTQIPAADLVVYGLAEARIGQLINVARWREVPMTDAYVIGRHSGALDYSPELDFTLMDGFREYQPCVEVSRGCGMGCNFCAEASVPLGGLKEPRLVAKSLSRLSALYRGGINPYLQASFFRPPTSWIEELRVEFGRRRILIPWRAETRVDGLAPSQIPGLAASGLKVLDLGLESASPTQLLRMEKTTNPSAYLRRAEALLEACAQNDIWTKVNVLLFPGETSHTFRETEDWLERNRSRVKGLSVGPMIVFRYNDESSKYLGQIGTWGASAVDASDLEQLGYAHINLSSEMSHSDAVRNSLYLSRSFMTAGDYFDLKSFSYFPRGFTRQQFDELLLNVDNTSLPFSA